MSNQALERRFARIGARLKVEEGPWRGSPRLDVRSDPRGEYFDLRFLDGSIETEVHVVDLDRTGRHLLLFVREGEDKSKFLCGHDERHWFVAAVPEDARGVTGVREAKAALQPDAVRSRAARLRRKDRFRRRNDAFVRQGEWFFVPEPRLRVDARDALRDEPISRGSGTAHVCELVFRRGGEVVYVNDRHPAGISEARFARLTENQRRSGGWIQMLRDPEVYAKGAVRHPDHATIVLRGWHRVLMNTEHRAKAMRFVAFLD